MKKQLSTKQQNIISFIRKFLQKKGYPPTVRDVVRACNISSTSVAAYNLDILEREGYIRRHPGISRGIEIVKKGVVAAPSQTNEVPMLGVIAAGKPIPVPAEDAWNTAASADTVEVTEDLTRGREGIYALKVRGTSMIDALINDGDIVLMQNANAVENGETAAVWLKDEKEVTLKKVYVEKNRVRLQPANSKMSALYTTPDNIEIQGKVIGVIRQIA
jgi:repressor LexA